MKHPNDAIQGCVAKTLSAQKISVAKGQVMQLLQKSPQ